jgi:hypothetical protein
MGQIVKLIKLIERLAELNDEDVIYACEPWTEDSDAMVGPDPELDSDAMLPEAVEAGMTFFLEVFIIREVVEGWTASLNEKPT